MNPRTLALVGAAGGVGTTRLTLEIGATLARGGRDVAVLDTAYATQGLGDHCPGRIDPDITAQATEDDPLTLFDHPATEDLTGRLALCPARAPFARIARAKTPEAAQRLEGLVGEAADRFDHVLVDTPPVAANQAVAAVTCADRVALVTPATRRGADALPRMADRLVDVGAPADLEIANRVGESNPVDRADVTVPESDANDPGDVPACVTPDEAFAPAVAAVTEAAFETDLDLEFPEGGRLGRFLSRGED